MKETELARSSFKETKDGFSIVGVVGEAGPFPDLDGNKRELNKEEYTQETMDDELTSLNPSKNSKDKKQKPEKKELSQYQEFLQLLEDPALKPAICLLKFSGNLIILFIWYLMIMKAYDYWNQSLIGCGGDLVLCLIKMQSKLSFIMISVTKSAVLIFLVFISSFHVRNWCVKCIGISVPITIAAYLVTTCKGFKWEDHSLGNFLFMQGVWIVCITLYLFTWFSYRLFSWKKKVFFIWIFALMLIWTAFYYDRIAQSCDHFNDSLHPDYML